MISLAFRVLVLVELEGCGTLYLYVFRLVFNLVKPFFILRILNKNDDNDGDDDVGSNSQSKDCMNLKPASVTLLCLIVPGLRDLID